MRQQAHAIQAICNILHLVKSELSAPDLESAKAEVLQAVEIRFAIETESGDDEGG
jgi:hypothetical protein